MLNALKISNISEFSRRKIINIVSMQFPRPNKKIRPIQKLYKDKCSL